MLDLRKNACIERRAHDVDNGKQLTHTNTNFRTRLLKLILPF